MLSLAIVPASFLKLLVELNTQFHKWVHVFHFNRCISIIRDFKMSPMLLKGLRPVLEGFVVPMHVRNRKSNPEGVARGI